MAFFARRWPAVMLWPLSWLYGLAVDRRNRRYDTGVASCSRLDCPVISVGNIVVGGSGKTPTVIFLARWLQQRGKKVCVISRGYRRQSQGRVLVADGERILASAAEAGDEPVLLAQQLPGTIVVVEAERAVAGRWALQAFRPDLILLDDGFQHRRLHRDLDIVTFKGRRPLGNGWLLPAGPLRESLGGIRRADLLWFNAGAELPQNVPAEIREKPRVEARLQVTGCCNSEGRLLGASTAVRALLFCGVAGPEGFLETARETGLQIVRFIRYRDHHAYTHRDLMDLEQARRQYQAEVIVTTEKDWVKIGPSGSLPPYWYRLTVAVQPQDPSDTDGLLQTLCGRSGIL